MALTYAVFQNLMKFGCKQYGYSILFDFLIDNSCCNRRLRPDYRRDERKPKKANLMTTSDPPDFDPPDFDPPDFDPPGNEQLEANLKTEMEAKLQATKAEMEKSQHNAFFTALKQMQAEMQAQMEAKMEAQMEAQRKLFAEGQIQIKKQMESQWTKAQKMEAEMKAEMKKANKLIQKEVFRIFSNDSTLIYIYSFLFYLL